MMLRGLLWVERSDCRGATLLLGAGLSLLAVAGAFGWQNGSVPGAGSVRATEADASKALVAGMSMQELIEAVKEEFFINWQREVRDTMRTRELAARLADPMWAERVKAAIQADADSGSGFLRSSPLWFEDEPYAVWFRVPVWLRGYRVSATVVSPMSLTGVQKKAQSSFIPSLRCGTAPLAEQEDAPYQVLGTLPRGTSSVTLRVSISKVESPPSGVAGARASAVARVLWSGDVTLPVELVPHKPIEAVSTPEIDAAVRGSVEIVAYAIESLRHESGKDPCFEVLATGTRQWSGPLRSVLFAAAIDLCYDGTPIHIWYMSDPDESKREAEAFRDREELRGVIAEKLWNRDEIERFTLRVRGVPPVKPSRWCRTQYWSGSYTVPLAKVFKRFSSATLWEGEPHGDSDIEWLKRWLDER